MSSVTCRGFLYQTEEGAWVIAREPQLKTCCLSQHQVIEVIGPFTTPSPYQAITLQGHYDTAGRFYVTEIETGSLSGVWVGMGFLVAIAAGFYSWKRRA